MINTNLFFDFRVESWLHFPLARQRLVRLIQHHVPPSAHVYFVSGDVHYGEFIYGNEHLPPLEITSSGLTHSCLNPFWGSLCPYIHYLFGSYHTSPYRNFGELNVAWEENRLSFRLRNASNGKVLQAFNASIDGRESGGEGVGNRFQVWQEDQRGATMADWLVRVLWTCLLLVLVQRRWGNL